MRPRYEKVGSRIVTGSLSPTGSRAVFEAPGGSASGSRSFGTGQGSRIHGSVGAVLNAGGDRKTQREFWGHARLAADHARGRLARQERDLHVGRRDAHGQRRSVLAGRQWLATASGRPGDTDRTSQRDDRGGIAEVVRLPYEL